MVRGMRLLSSCSFAHVLQGHSSTFCWVSAVSTGGVPKYHVRDCWRRQDSKQTPYEPAPPAAEQAGGLTVYRGRKQGACRKPPQNHSGQLTPRWPRRLQRGFPERARTASPACRRGGTRVPLALRSGTPPSPARSARPRSRRQEPRPRR